MGVGLSPELARGDSGGTGESEARRQNSPKARRGSGAPKDYWGSLLHTFFCIFWVIVKPKKDDKTDHFVT